MLKKIIAVIAMLMVVASVAYATECTTPKQPGCWEVVALNVAYDGNNPLMSGLDKVSSQTAEQRVERVEQLGLKLWHAQHEGKIQAAGPASFLVFVWKGGKVSDPVGFRVTGGRTMEQYNAQVVTGDPKITPSKLDGYGAPDAIYRITTSGISASILLPQSSVDRNTFIVICREGKGGVYPNTQTLHQGHAISRETVNWYKGQGVNGQRTVIPFLSM